MLQIVLGRAGSGKTTFIREKICEETKKRGGQSILIVPEQFSFESERALLKMMGAKNFLNVHVFSFSRLYETVCLDCTKEIIHTLDDSGRVMMMGSALWQVQDELTIYQKHTQKPDFIEAMLMAASEFKVCAIPPGDLAKTAGRLNQGTLKTKAKEIALILDTYDTLINTIAADPIDNLTRLYDLLGENSYFENKRVYIDSFNGFTGQELKILSRIFTQSDSTTIALCADYLHQKEGRFGLFSHVQDTVQRIIRIAKQHLVTVKTPVVLGKPMRFINPVIASMECDLFNPCAKPDPDLVEGIEIYEASTAYNEAQYAATKILELVRDHHYRYQDIIIMARSLPQYQGVLDTTLGKYGVPFFMDQREPIDCKPLVAAVSAALAAIESFGSDDIFRLLKTDLTDITVEECAMLENYCLLWKISGKQWLLPWDYHPDGYSAEFNETSRKTLDTINALRELAVRPLVAFLEKCKQKSTGTSMAKALYELLLDYHMPVNVQRLSDALMRSGEDRLSNEQGRLWDCLMELINQSAICMGDEPVTFARYKTLFLLSLQSIDLGHIPQGLDVVCVGSADRMRPSNPKAVFIIGANEGVFPQNVSPKGLLSDRERETLIDAGLPLTGLMEKQASEEQFLAYAGMMSASDRLYISYLLQGAEGDPLLPSVLVSQVRDKFPNVKWRSFDQIPIEETIAAPVPAFELTAKLWREQSPKFKALYAYFAGRPDGVIQVKALENAAAGSKFAFCDPQNATQLFGQDMRISPSKIEKFHLCPFRYFCEYGLDAKPRKAAELGVMEYGLIIHYLLEHLIQTFGNGLGDASSEEILTQIDALLLEYANRWMGGLENKPVRFKVLFGRMKKAAGNLVLHIAKELAQSDFEPANFELSIGNNGDVKPIILTIPGGGSVTIEGKVDRVDIMPAEQGNFVRVIDYKTGEKKFALSDIVHGLNMQMLIYLISIWNGGQDRYGRVIPAGVLYMPSKPKEVSAARDTSDEKYQQEVAKNNKMNGIVLADSAVILGMEKDAGGRFIPVKCKKDGSIAKQSSVATLSEMEVIAAYIKKRIVTMASTLKNGMIDAMPATSEVSGGYDACTWCDYRTVCCKEDDDAVNRIEHFTAEETLDIMKKQLGSNRDTGSDGENSTLFDLWAGEEGKRGGANG